MTVTKSDQMKHPPTDDAAYTDIVQSTTFQSLLREKKKFIIPLTIFFLCFYFALPLLSSYTDILNRPFIGSITWAWAFAFMQFIMTWGLCMLYSKKAAKFDELSDRILKERGR